MVINRSTDELWQIHPMEYDSEIKKEYAVDTHNVDESQSNLAEWSRTKKKDFLLYDAIYVKFQKMQTHLKGSEVVWR